MEGGAIEAGGEVAPIILAEGAGGARGTGGENVSAGGQQLGAHGLDVRGAVGGTGLENDQDLGGGLPGGGEDGLPVGEFAERIAGPDEVVGGEGEGGVEAGAAPDCAGEKLLAEGREGAERLDGAGGGEGGKGRKGGQGGGAAAGAEIEQGARRREAGGAHGEGVQDVRGGFVIGGEGGGKAYGKIGAGEEIFVEAALGGGLARTVGRGEGFDGGAHALGAVARGAGFGFREPIGHELKLAGTRAGGCGV